MHRTRWSQTIDAKGLTGDGERRGGVVFGRGRGAGFTLIELLLVIAVIGLLVSLLIPAAAKCTLLSRQARELSAGQQLMTALTLYSDDYRGQILPGYAKAAWVNGPMEVRDIEGTRLTNEVAQRYPWRIAPYMNYELRGLYNNANFLKDLRNRTEEIGVAGADVSYVVSLFPSLGMNAAFIGGSDLLQEFDRSFQRVFGRVHIERFDQMTRPSGVAAFFSARAEEQIALPTIGRPDGFFRVDPPVFGAAQGVRWDTAYDARAASPGNNSGFVSLRHGGKAVAAHMDGHADVLGWDQVRDMRRWADQADGPDWGLRPR